MRFYGITFGWADETYTDEASETRMDSILYGVMLATLVELPRGRVKTDVRAVTSEFSGKHF